MLTEMDVYDVEIARPFRVKRGRVVRAGELERAVTQALRSRSGATGVLVILDADDDCPAELASKLCQRNAKGALSQRMRGNRGYVATDDQPALLASMDLDLASKRSPSFAKLRRDIAALVGKN